jgi:hypothetical protein
MALEAFAILAAQQPSLRDEALEKLEAARHNTDIALRARARLMLPLLVKPETEPRRQRCVSPEA